MATRISQDPKGRPLSALVNNAGASLNAPIETLSIERWRDHFEVNFFGHVALTKALLPALISARGRVVNISSIGGLVALPTFGPYAAAKFALEAFSDVLRRELTPAGVSVVVIEPGTIATEIWGKQITALDQETATWTDSQHTRYDSLMKQMTQQAQSAGAHGVSSADAAEVIVDAVSTPQPETRYLIGEDAAGLAQARHDLSEKALGEMLTDALRNTT